MKDLSRVKERISTASSFVQQLIPFLTIVSIGLAIWISSISIRAHLDERKAQKQAKKATGA